MLFCLCLYFINNTNKLESNLRSLFFCKLYDTITGTHSANFPNSHLAQKPLFNNCAFVKKLLNHISLNERKYFACS